MKLKLRPAAHFVLSILQRQDELHNNTTLILISVLHIENNLVYTTLLLLYCIYSYSCYISPCAASLLCCGHLRMSNLMSAVTPENH